MTTLYVSSIDGDDHAPPSSPWFDGNRTTYKSIAGALAVAVPNVRNLIFVDSAHNFCSDEAVSWDAPAGSAIRIVSVNRVTGIRQEGATETAAVTSFVVAGGQSWFLDGILLVGRYLLPVEAPELAGIGE